MKYTPRLPRSNANVSKTSPLKEFALLLAGVAGILVGIYLIMGLAVDFMVPRLSPEFEIRFGKHIARNFKTADEDAPKTRAIQELTRRIQARCATLPYEVIVHVRNTPVFNAAALPGGHMLIFQGLLDKVETENELAFVLGHEMGHMANRDHLRAMGRALVLIALSSLILGSDNPIADVVSNSLNLTELAFSRQQETRADAFGLDVLNCYYGHVAGAAGFFRKMNDERPDRLKLSHYFSTHPDPDRRIDFVTEYAASHDYPVGDPVPVPPIMTSKPATSPVNESDQSP